MKRSYDPVILDEAIKPYKDTVGEFDPVEWVHNLKNHMYEKEGSVALFTYEYPGVYSGHWFFKHRGKNALKLAKEILTEFFSCSDAQAIRGLTRVDIKPARWAARQIGMTSYGIITINEKDYELFCMTKKEFLNG